MFYTNNGTTILVSAGGHGASVGSASGTITDDTVYKILGTAQTVYALISVSCSAQNGGSAAYGIRARANPAIDTTCAQGLGGPSTPPVNFANTFSVPFAVAGGHVEFTTVAYASAQGDYASNSSSISLKFLGFQDAQGVAVAATVVPEPATWIMWAVGLGIVALRRRS